MSFTSEDYRQLLREFSQQADEKYKAFQQSLVPTSTLSYGIRMPIMRRMGKAIAKEDAPGFLKHSNADSYEEIFLKGLVIAYMEMPMNQKLPHIREYLPLISNWAICDSFSSSFVLKDPKDKELIWDFIRPLFLDEREYFARFAAVMFIFYFVDREHICEGISFLEKMPQPQYYVQMAVAWAVAECYIKFPEASLPLLQRRTLPPFTQNKSIQKIRDSRRVSRKEKDMLVQYKL